MKSKPRSISITSGKGGTSKTLLTANLGISMTNQDVDVTILDGDLGMANLAIVMGMHCCPVSFLDVLSRNADCEDAIYENYGVKVVPTGFRFEDTQELISKEGTDVAEIVEELLHQTEFLLIDAPAEIADATIVSKAASREMLPVTNPMYSSLVDCYKTIRLANVLNSWTRGLIVNRVGKSSDLSLEEIDHFMEKTIGSLPILKEIPEDPLVLEAEREGIPFVVYDPDCPASEAVHELAKIVTGEEELPYTPYEEGEVDETIERLCRALTGRRI